MNFPIINRPNSVTVDNAGNIYACGTGSPQVYKMTPAGVVSQVSFTSLQSPSAIAVDSAGTVYVAESKTGIERIYKKTAAGVQSQIIVPDLRKPTDLRFDSAGNLYVVDSWNARIVRIKPNGVQDTIPPGGLDTPFAVHVDAAGTVTVSNRAEWIGVVQYTTSGVQTTVPLTGLDQPTGLDFDTDGNMYIAQSGQSGTTGARVLKYAPDGTQSVVPFPLNDPNESLYRPMGICVRNGNIYVADQLGYIIQRSL
ncbi:hypothetical protein ACFRAQ_35895 [Nocardia sp. NPDC056611]|uniref:hypothetical protein n=1 Tax=Nocardia sp. NPDC056611 TaxID=3345877 RepID=UPI00366F86D3